MTSKALVRSVLGGGLAHRVPTGPLAVHFCARFAGHSLSGYSTDARVLADSVLRYYAAFRPDAVWVSADTWVSAEALGARVGAAGEDQPVGGVGPPLIQTARDIDRLPSPDMDRGRYPVLLEALERVVRGVGNEAFVVACFDQYPFSLAAALMGIDRLMLSLHDDPAFARALIARCEEQVTAYGRAMARLGPDLLSGGDSPAGLIGPRAYEAEALPAERRVIAALKRTTGLPVSLHICGDTRRLLRQMSASGADVLEIDHAVELRAGLGSVREGVTLWGNLDPVGLLAQGTPEAIRVAAQEAVSAASGRRFVLSSGCTLAVETPAENLRALLEGGSGAWRRT